MCKKDRNCSSYYGLFYILTTTEFTEVSIATTLNITEANGQKVSGRPIISGKCRSTSVDTTYYMAIQKPKLYF